MYIEKVQDSGAVSVPGTPSFSMKAKCASGGEYSYFDVTHQLPRTPSAEVEREHAFKSNGDTYCIGL